MRRLTDVSYSSLRAATDPVDQGYLCNVAGAIDLHRAGGRVGVMSAFHRAQR